MIDCVKELLGSGHALEAVDVDDRCGIAHLIEPVLDVRRSSRIRITLVDEVSDQNGLAKSEFPCQLIRLLSHRWLFHNGPTNARHQASLPLSIVAISGLHVVIHVDHDCHGPNRQIIVLVHHPPTLHGCVVNPQPLHVAEGVGCLTYLSGVGKSKA